MSLRAGETKRCEGCGEPLIGARTRAGEVAPITYNVKLGGNVLLFRAAGNVIECRTFAGATLEALKAEAVPLRLNHFADCPNREQFERGAA